MNGRSEEANKAIRTWWISEVRVTYELAEEEVARKRETISQFVVVFRGGKADGKSMAIRQDSSNGTSCPCPRDYTHQTIQ